jgi:hypothetical protein
MKSIEEPTLAISESYNWNTSKTNGWQP